MRDPSFVAGDWGTTHCRLFLCDADGSIHDRVTGPGAAEANGRFAALFDGLTASWRQGHGELPAVLCGMVGSSFGWVQAPYVPCPASAQQVAAACVSPRDARVHIVPGVSCHNRFGAPDFMRGEETQILGALRDDPTLRGGHQLLCLPGTHTKWVVLRDGAIGEFLSAPTGEVFAVLRDHSVLIRDAPLPDSPIGGAAFAEGLAALQRFPQAQLLHRLFECRARRLSGELNPQSAAAYLSGLLIGSDVGGALQSLEESAATGAVHVIGDPQLTALYAQCIASHDRDAVQIEGAGASIAGLTQLHAQLTQRRLMHAAH